MLGVPTGHALPCGLKWHGGASRRRNFTSYINHIRYKQDIFIYIIMCIYIYICIYTYINCSGSGQPRSHRSEVEVRASAGGASAGGAGGETL